MEKQDGLWAGTVLEPTGLSSVMNETQQAVVHCAVEYTDPDTGATAVAK